MRKRTILIAFVLVLVGSSAWYWFRPELLVVNAKVNEAFPPAGPGTAKVLSKGSFHSVAHDSQGAATLYRLPDGKRVLRFTEFETSNGPALFVYLIVAEDARDSDTVKGVEFINLGELKGNLGDQNYEIPDNIDLSKYRAVTIWCRRFSVNFATAPLIPVSG